MNQNKPFYIVLVVSTCIIMVLCGFMLNFAWTLRTDTELAKTNIVNEQKYAVAQIKKAGNELANKSKEVQAATQALENHKIELSNIESNIRQTIKEYESARSSLPESVQKSENNARAFIAIWQSSLEEDDDGSSLLMSKQDVERERDDKTGGVAFYHTLSRVFTPSGLITYAQKHDKNISTVASALKVLRADKTMILIPIY